MQVDTYTFTKGFNIGRAIQLITLPLAPYPAPNHLQGNNPVPHCHPVSYMCAIWLDVVKPVTNQLVSILDLLHLTVTSFFNFLIFFYNNYAK